jgi:hypothetical protein
MSRDIIAATERALIADAIINPATVRLVREGVAPQDFEDITLGNLYGLVLGMISAYGAAAVSTATVVQEIGHRREAEKDRPDHKRTRWPSDRDIVDLVTAGTHGSPHAHAKAIREAAMGRSGVKVAIQTAQAIQSGGDPAVVIAQAVEEMRKIRDGHRPVELPRKLAGDLFATIDDPYDWVIPGLLERLDRFMLTGGEGAGKSTLIRQLAICAAAGCHPFTADPIPAQRVLFVDCENSERQWRRAARTTMTAAGQRGTGDPTETLMVANVGRIVLTRPSTLAAVHALMDEHEPDIVVIGPIYKLAESVNSEEEVGPLFAALDSLRERGAAMLIEAHAGHGTAGPAGERNLRPRGSSALLGWPEFGFGLARDSNIKGRFELVRWRGDRDERDWPPALRRGGVLPWTDDRLTHSEGRTMESGKDRAVKD